MQMLTLAQVADYLESATIEETHDKGFVITHFGKNAAGARFVLVNNCFGNSVVTESM